MVVLSPKEWKPTSLSKAEAEAINWAVHQIVSHNIHKAIVESDAKVCIEAMLESSSRPPWRIEVLTADALSLAHRDNSLEFKWLHGLLLIE